MMTSEHEKISVHPGWMVLEHLEHFPTDEIQTQNEQFEAFQWLNRASGAIERAAADALSDMNLTSGAFGALLEVANAGPNGIAPSEMARKLYIARRTATLYIDTLVKHGWAVRHGHPDDKRMVLASLSTEGAALLDRYGDECRRRLAELMAPLGADQAVQLSQLLRDLVSYESDAV